MPKKDKCLSEDEKKETEAILLRNAFNARQYGSIRTF